MKSRHVQRLGLLFGAVLAASLFFVGGAALRLFMGPVSLGPFAGAIEDSLNRSITGLVVRFDRAVLEWSRHDGNLNLIILGAKVFDVNGRIVAQAPKADLDFDAAAMLSGDFALKRFALLGVQLTAVRNADGTLKLGFGPVQGDADIIKIIRETLEKSAAGGGSLQNFSIREARLAFRDDQTGVFLVSPRMTFALENQAGGFNAAIEAMLEISGAPATVAIRASLRDDGTPASGTMDIRGLQLDALARNSPKFAALAPYAMTTDLRGRFALSPDGVVQTADVQLAASGRVAPEFLNAPMTLDRVSAVLHYDGQAQRLHLSEAAVAGPEIDATADADLRFAWRDGVLANVTIGLTGAAEKLAPPGLFEAPIALDRIVLQAGYEPGAGRLTARRLAFAGNAVSAEFSGTVERAGSRSPAIAATGSLQPVAIRDLLAYWPVRTATGARAWLGENLLQGRLGPAVLTAKIPAGALDADSLPEDALSIAFPLEDISARYMRGLTPLTRGQGTALLTGDTFRVRVSSGNVGPLQVGNGEIVIADLHVRHAPGNFKVHVEGRVPDVLTLIDMEPLGYARRFQLTPAQTSGQAALDLDFTIPMRRDLKVEDVKIGVAGTLSGLALQLDKRPFDSGVVTLAIDNQKLTAEGTGRLSATPVAFRWTEVFETPGVTTTVALQARLDDAARANLRWTEPSWVKGPMPVTATLTGRRFRFQDARVRADLTNATASIPAIGFEKRAGTEASATAQIRFAEGATSIGDLAVTGSGISARGGLTLNAAGEVVSADLTDIRAGDNNAFALAIDGSAPGQRIWRIRGRSLDARPMIGDPKPGPEARQAAGAGSAAAEKTEAFFDRPITIEAQLERILVRDDLALRDTNVSFSMGQNERITGFSLDGSGPGPRGKISGRFAEANGVRTLTVESDSGGDFMRAFTGFPSVRDGRATLNVTFPQDGKAANYDYAANFVLNNFTVVDQPFLARLFSSGSLDGPLRLLQGEGISFHQLEAPFTSRDRVWTFRNGRASGAAIGFSFQGMIDNEKDRIDLNGSLVPVYGLNSALGSLPVVGNLFTSKESEGVFAMTYRIHGALNEPQVMINPLSVLTPGIFRRIFEFATPRQAPAAQAQPPGNQPQQRTQ